MKRLTFILAVSIFLVACYLLYTSLDAANARKKEYYEKEKKEIDNLENKLRRLEDDLEKNEQLINDIRENIYKVVGGGQRAASGFVRPITSVDQLMNLSRDKSGLSLLSDSYRAVFDTEACADASSHSKTSTDVQMLDMYNMLGFDNPDGGVWKQGWDIKYDKEVVEKQKPRLEVIVVPHSHCDPGWIKTFEKYYQDQTRHILDNMVSKLSAEKKMSFIYAEISFFERWWRDIDDVKRNAVRKILENGQLEIVTGAWVMTDEANSHYYSMVDQMIEGHQWLENHLGYKPKNHWSIDPFGLSPTMAYLLQRANFSTMIIQRVHYAVKKRLAKEKQLEFMWRQLWAGDAQTDIFCHMFPFYSYDIPHTCGPNPKLCCQFDFKRLPGGSVGCPWNVPPSPITEFNVHERALTLLDQYRKKAELYKTNVVLVPLGDDFRYDTSVEWNAQYSNYEKLFSHMNAKPEFNVYARFGTLDDYFNLLRQRTNSEPRTKPEGFPVLSGDFFTYADRDDHYWSGYYTSRPLHKRLDRVMIHYLRGAEIAYSLSVGLLQRDRIAGYPFEQLFVALVEARRNLALFQHHDGITGTAKDHVVVDYGQRLLQSINACKNIMAASAQLMMSPEKSDFQTDLDTLSFDIDEKRVAHDSIAEKVVIGVAAKPRSIVFYNSLAQERRELVCLRTENKNVQVKTSDGRLVVAQLNPVVYKNNDKIDLSSVLYEICFEVSVPPLGFSHYTIQTVEKPDSIVFGSLKSNFKVITRFPWQRFSDVSDEGFQTQSPYLSAQFSSKSGFLQSIKLAEDQRTKQVQIEFVKYGTQAKKEKSGAYLFLPDGPGKTLDSDQNQFVFIDGPLMARVVVLMPTAQHTVTVSKLLSYDGQSLSIDNQVNIKQEYNYELAMRIKTDIQNKDRVFYTDLNGFQLIKRKYFSKIPLQGNYYPMPTAAYLEDEGHRFTVLSGQPLGVANLETGWIEIMLDRRLMQDDNRGLFQGITDNRLTPDLFRILLEPLKGNSPPHDSKIGYHTGLAHHTSYMLLNPLFTLYRKEIHQQSELLASYSALSSPFPCDIHLVNLRTLEEAQDYSNTESFIKPKREQALLLHRFTVDCRSSQALALNCNSIDGTLHLEKLFADAHIENITETSLTLMYRKETIPSSSILRLQPMDLSVFKVFL